MWPITVYGYHIIMSPYNIMNGLGLIIGLLSLDFYLDEKLPDKRNIIYSIFVFSILLGWLGAHIFDWLVGGGSFKTAGFTFLGGLFVGAISFLLIAQIYLQKKDTKNALNCAVIPLLLGHGIGRIGCYLGGCCYGKCLSKSALLAPIFTRHPTQLYETAFLFLLAAILHIYRKNYFQGMTDIYIMSYGIFRFLVELIRADDRGEFYGLSTSQWISIVLILFVLVRVSIPTIKKQLYFLGIIHQEEAS